MLKGNLPRVIYHQIYQYTKTTPVLGVVLSSKDSLNVTLVYRGTSFMRNYPPPRGRHRAQAMFSLGRGAHAGHTQFDAVPGQVQRLRSRFEGLGLGVHTPFRDRPRGGGEPLASQKRMP